MSSITTPIHNPDGSINTAYVKNQMLSISRVTSLYARIANNDYQKDMDQAGIKTGGGGMVKGGPNGGIVNVRTMGYAIPNRGRVSTTSAVSQFTEEISVSYETMLNNQFEIEMLSAAVNYTQETNSYVKGIITPMWAELDSMIAEHSKYNIPIYYDATGVSTFSWETLTNAYSAANYINIPTEQRSIICNENVYNELLISMKSQGIYVESLNRELLNRELSRTSKYDIYTTVNTTTACSHVSSYHSGKILTVKAFTPSDNYVEGTISLTGGVTGVTLKKGDRLSFDASNYLGVATKVNTPVQFQAVVLEDKADVVGDYDNVRITPGIMPKGINPSSLQLFENVNVGPAIGSIVRVLKSHQNNFVYTKKGLTFGFLKMGNLSSINPVSSVIGPKMDAAIYTDKMGNSVRIQATGNVEQDKSAIRVDIMPYFKAFQRQNYSIVTDYQTPVFNMGLREAGAKNENEDGYGIMTVQDQQNLAAIKPNWRREREAQLKYYAHLESIKCGENSDAQIQVSLDWLADKEDSEADIYMAKTKKAKKDTK